MPSTYVYAGCAVAALFIVQRIVEFRRVRARVGGVPGLRLLLNFFVPLPAKYIPGIYVNWGFLADKKYDVYDEFGTEMFSEISFFPTTMSMVHVADPLAIKEITTSRSRFPKPVEIYKLLSFYGPNIVTTEGDEWKRHRRPVAPAFSEKNNRLVWDESIRITRTMFDSRDWRGRESVAVDHVVQVTLAIALFVIGAAGFGRQVSWDEDHTIAPAHKMTFKEALNTAAGNLAIGAILPRWMFSLTPKWRRVGTAFNEIKLYMQEMIHDRRNALEKEERFDLFSGLLQDGGELTDDELMGNVFIFLVAGHETTAHTLAFTFGLLAVYQDEQEKLYQHIKSILPDDRVPAYEEMHKFTYSLSVFYETLRLYTPIPAVSKTAAEDTTLLVTRKSASTGAWERVPVPIAAGTQINLGFPGVHANPRYWDSPGEFRPERFLAPDWPRDAFLPFSAGPRACIGRKFFETEGVAILTTLVASYKITVRDDPRFKGLHGNALREELLRGQPIITMAPYSTPLVFTRRK